MQIGKVLSLLLEQQKSQTIIKRKQKSTARSVSVSFTQQILTMSILTIARKRQIHFQRISRNCA